MKDQIHEMIQQFRIDARSSEAIEANINQILNILDKLNDKIDELSWQNRKLT
jgi:hypothetical protein